MANFAQLDENNKVINIVVVSNDIMLDINGNEDEQLGIDFLKSMFGDNVTFIQTSITGKIRKRFACLGMIYEHSIDAFIEEKPYPSWHLDEELADWLPPIPKPGEPYVYDHLWNEELLQWEKID